MKKFLMLFALLAAGCSGATASSDAEKQNTNTPAQTAEKPASDAAEASDSAALEGTTLISIHVPAMSCPEGCVPFVKEALVNLDGVQKCDVDFESKTAHCQVDPEKFDAEMAVAALVVAGFEGSEVTK